MMRSQWAVENGITQGCGNGRNFCPEQTLNRAHMVTFLKRYHDKFGSDASDANDASDNSENSDDPEEHVIDGIGSDSVSISLPAGRYSVEFTVVHTRDLAEISLIAEDSGIGVEEILPVTDLKTQQLQTFRGRYNITVGNSSVSWILGESISTSRSQTLPTHPAASSGSGKSS